MRYRAAVLSPFCIQALASTPIQDAQLLDAAYRCDVERVKELLAKGANPNARSPRGQTPLYLLEFGNSYQSEAFDACAQILLAAGADINASNGDGETPLMQCFVGGFPNLKRIEFLLEHGADVNRQDKDGKSALMRAGAALWRDNEALWKLLSKYKPDLELRNQEGNTVLLCAALQSSPYEHDLERWIELGADLHARNQRGETVLHLLASSKSGHAMLVRVLKDGADPNVQDLHGSSPLHCVVKAYWEYPERKLAMLKALLSAGARSDPRNERGSTPLAQACALGNDAAVEVLLAAGANPSNRDLTGVTPLAEAARRGRFRIVHRLVECGARLEEAYPGDWPSLRKALLAGDESAWAKAQRVEESRIEEDLWQSMVHTWPALTLAAMNGDIPLLEAAIQRGVFRSEDIPEAYFRPEPDFLVTAAACFGQTQLLDFLDRSKAIPLIPEDGLNPLLGARIAAETDPRDLSRYIQWQEKHPEVFQEPVAFMEIAAASGNLPVLEMLLQKQVNPIPPCGPTTTRLFNAAASYQQWETLQFLLRMNHLPENPQGVDAPRESFWDLVTKRSPGVDVICDIILANPKSIGITNESERSILWSDAIRQSPDAVKRLVAHGIPREAFLGLGSPFLGRGENPEIIAFLFEKPFSGIDHVPPKGLPLVARAETPEILNRLLDLGAKTEWLGPDGKPVYLLHHLMKRMGKSPNLALAYMKRSESRLQINLEDAEGRLPLDIAGGLGFKPARFESWAEQKQYLDVKKKIQQLLVDGGARSAIPKPSVPSDVLTNPELRRNAIETSLEKKDLPILEILLSDKSALDPNWPWVDWMNRAFQKGPVKYVEALIGTGLVPHDARVQLYWKEANRENIPWLSRALGTVDLKPESNARVLLMAAQKGDLKGLKQALEYAPVDARDEYGQTPLMLAVRNGHLPAVRLLIARGAKADAKSLDKRYPLHVALDLERIDIALALISEAGASLAQRDEQGHFPLTRAILDGKRASIDMLIDQDKNAKETIYENWQSAPLLACAKTGDLKTLKKLVRHWGMNPGLDQALLQPLHYLFPIAHIWHYDAQKPVRSFAWTPVLAAAVYHDQPHVVDWLLARSVSASEISGNTVLPYLVSKGDATTIRKIDRLLPQDEKNKQIEHEYSTYACVLNAIEKHGAKVLQALLDAGFPPQQHFRNGKNGLHVSIRKNDLASLRILLATKQVPIDQEGGEGPEGHQSPLLLALHLNRPECVEALLEAGADPKTALTKGKGSTMLHTVTTNFYRENDRSSMRPIVDLLIRKYHVDVNQCDGLNNFTALDFADDPGNAELAAILQEYGGKRMRTGF